MRQSKTEFIGDERAIEGLPIRLVIALVVGVAALGVMMSVLGGIGSFGNQEVTVTLDEELANTNETVEISVVTEDGEPVEDAYILVKSGSLTLPNGPVKLDASSGTATLNLDVHTLSFRAGQSTGTLELEVIPPSDGNYADSADNPDVTVISGG